MCKDCGCSGGTQAHGHHAHGHHHHDHETIPVNTAILSANDRFAERNRGFFAGRSWSVVNLVSSPGSGKTAILERTIREFGARHGMAVIVGDLATDNDARRLRGAGGRAVQIATGHACHLDAHLVAHALEDLDPEGVELLVIENVGNLVCPASFDLGEHERVVVVSVTEGEDKPLKYPVIFRDARVVLVNKCDLSEAVGFRREDLLANIREVAPEAEIIELSARTGAGFDAWYAHLERLLANRRAPAH